MLVKPSMTFSHSQLWGKLAPSVGGKGEGRGRGKRGRQRGRREAMRELTPGALGTFGILGFAKRV